MTRAQAVDRIVVLAVHRMDGETILETACEDYEEFRRLPPAVTWAGRELGLTGWNSDRHRVYYRSDALLASPSTH